MGVKGRQGYKIFVVALILLLINKLTISLVCHRDNSDLLDFVMGVVMLKAEMSLLSRSDNP